MLHQSPQDAVVKLPESPEAHTLLDFGIISEWVIPRQEFCNQLLTFCTGKHRVVGYPVCITDEERYERNQFIFNICLVLSNRIEFSGYEKVVQRIAKAFQGCEEQHSFLSKDEQRLAHLDESDDVEERGSRVHAICEAIREGLNHQSECELKFGKRS